MLKKIEIYNFLTIEHVILEIESGLTSIIGESGAGKSLILKAIDSVFAQKTDTSIVGGFSNESLVKLFFSLNKKQSESLSEFGIKEDEIVIEKVIKSKKAKAYINHEPISARILSEIKDILLNIVSQNYRFRFFDSNNILSMLDSLVDKKTKDEFEKAYLDYMDCAKNKNDMEERIAYIDEKHPEILLESIEKANPRHNEYESLLDKLKMVKSVSFIKEKSFEIIDKLYENDGSVESVLADVVKIFEKISSMGFDTKKIESSLNNISELLSDIKSDIYSMQQYIPEENLDEIESRLFELEQLQRKFNKPINQIVEEKERLKKMLKDREELQIELNEVKKILKDKVSILFKAAEKLSNKRKIAAKKIESEILKFLSLMMMENSVVTFEFSEKKIDDKGKDAIAILFSANPDIQADKIEKIASGGEKSRFILAMEAANSKIKKTQETIILDEIETGISEKTLEKTALVIKEISVDNSVILITHNKYLSDISESVYKIEKEFDGKMTKSLSKKIK